MPLKKTSGESGEKLEETRWEWVSWDIRRAVMSISLIVALSRNGVIGNQNKLPWHLPEDLKHFKALTMGHKIVMGRKTFAAIGRPLPGRENIVLTRDPTYLAAGVRVIHSPDEIHPAPDEEIFIIGGVEIYKLFLPRADRFYLTVIDKDFSGDAHFPLADWQSQFQIVEKSGPLLSEKSGLSHEFITAVKKTDNGP